MRLATETLEELGYVALGFTSSAAALEAIRADPQSAASQRADFPAQTERLVLSVAANQAVIGLQEARLLSEQRRAREELSRGVVFREQLMGILGHDLRNPLSAVHGLAEILQLDDSLSPKARERLGRIEQAAMRMSEMIDTILDFTRIRFNDEGLPVWCSGMNLGELCRDVVDEALAAHPGREVSLEMSGDLCGRWDRARLAQVLSNLVGNALTHGDEKQPVKLIATSDSTSVALDVVNRGPTIAAEQIETLFEPFVRGAGSDLGERRHGLGLGLYIAADRRIAWRHVECTLARWGDHLHRRLASLVLTSRASGGPAHRNQMHRPQRFSDQQAAKA